MILRIGGIEIKSIIILLLVFILIASSVFALINVDLDVNPSFKAGEQLSFDYTISSDTDTSIKFIPHMTCLRNGVALLEEKEVNLTANQPYSDTYYDFVVDAEHSNPANCNAYVKITEPEEQTEEQAFIIDIEEKLVPRIKTCLDPQCNFETRFFTTNENGFYIKVETEVNGQLVQSPTVTGYIEGDGESPMGLIFVDGVARVNVLPQGVYKINVEASKSGYRDGSKENYIAILTEHASYTDSKICKVDKVCDGNENMENCPQDCGSQNYNENERDGSMYSQGQVFLMSDRKWRDVLRFVPVTTWDFNSQIFKFPTLIYHDEIYYLENHNYGLDDHGAIASASSNVDLNPPNNINDGNFNTDWNSGSDDPASYFVIEFSEDVEYLNRIQIYGDEQHYVVVKKSLNGGSWTQLYRGILDADGLTEFTFTIGIARYIRVEITDTSQQDEIFANKKIKEVKAFDVGGRNYASSQNGGSIQSYSSEDPDYPITNVIDNNINNYWDSGEIVASSWVELDLSKIVTFDKINLYENYEPYYARIKVKANDNDPWITVSDIELLEVGDDPNVFKFSPVNAQYVRVEFADSEYQNDIPSWKGASEIEVYNSLGGLELNPSFDADSAIHFLQLYGAEKVVVVGDTPSELMDLLVAEPPLGAGLSWNQIEVITADDSYSYWRTFGGVVVADPDNYEGALIGSVYASYLNMPFALIGEENLEENENIIQNRFIYGVAPLDQSVIDYINANAEGSLILSIDDIQQEYLDIINTDKVLMVNPNDIGEVYTSPNGFYPDRTPYKIFDLFGKSSLAAPFLAAGKHELMLLNDIPISPLETECGGGWQGNPEIRDNVQSTLDLMVDQVNSLFLDYPPKFLTIVASPKAIPDSQYRSCAGDLGQYRYQKDFEYAKDPSDFVDLKKPDVAVDNNGDVHIVWVDDGLSSGISDNEIIYSKYDNNGNVLIDDVLITPGIGAVDNPKIDTDSDNNAYIVWEDLRNGDGYKEIYYAKIVDGEVVGEIVVSDVDYRMSDQPSINVDKDDFVYIAWREAYPTYYNTKIYYAKFDNRGNSILRNVMVSSDEGLSASFPNIDVDDNGYAHIVYMDKIPPGDVDFQTYYSRVIGTNVEIRRISKSLGETEKPNVAVDNNNGIHIVWSENREVGNNDKYYLYYSKLDNNGNIVVDNRQISEVEELTINPAIVAADKVHVIWKGYSNDLSAVLYRKLSINGALLGFEKTITKSGASIILPSFDKDSSDNFFVAYQAMILDDFVYYKKVDRNIRVVIPDTFVTKTYNYYMNPGRIYGHSTTDVSSYIARALFYDELMDRLYQDEYTGVSTARALAPGALGQQQLDALEIRERTKDSGYNSICSTEYDLDCDHTGRWDIPESFFEHKQYLTAADHGWIDAMDGVAYSSTLPLLELTWINDPSCSPANFWGDLDVVEPGVHTLGPTTLRKGAIGFHGATGVSLSSSLPGAPFSVRLLTQENRITLGEMGTYLTGIERYDDEYITLGDPTIVLRAKYVRWDDSGPIIRHRDENVR